VGNTRLLCQLIGSAQLLNLAQKCDAKRPCTTCLKAKGVSECIYDSEKLPELAGVYPVHRADGKPSGQDSGTYPAETPAVTLHNPIPSTSDTTGAVTCEPSASQVSEAGQDKVPHEPSSGLVRVRRNPPGRHVSKYSNPPISVIPCFPPSKIPPELKVPLSFLGEERLQVQTSEINATELDMRGCVLEQAFPVTNSPSDISRLWVFFRLTKLGTHLSRKKSDAYLRGDQSGTVLNRWFVCGPEALGIPFLKGFGDTPAMFHFFVRRTQSGWEGLVDLFRESDCKTKLQASVLVTAGNVLIRLPQTALLYIRKSCDFIKAGNLQFVPTYGRPPEFSEDLHETLAALSQTIYWANYVFLMCSGPEPHATAELEKEFRQDLPVGGPVSAPSCIQLIFTTASLPDPVQDLSSDDANRRYLACQGRDSAPHRPPCQR